MDEVTAADGRRRLVDLSHPILPGMTTYPGLPGPVLSDFLSREDSRGRYAPGTTFSIVRIEMVANTGTYVDAPFHRYAEGSDIAGLPLERLADLEGLNIDDTADGERPAHTLLLAAGIPIVEHLRGLAALPGEGFRFHCAPAPFRGTGSFPVRAYALIGGGKEAS
jgi:kynurenine formamidase